MSPTKRKKRTRCTQKQTLQKRSMRHNPVGLQCKKRIQIVNIKKTLAAWTHEKSTIESLRAVRHKDMHGNIISKISHSKQEGKRPAALTLRQAILMLRIRHVLAWNVHWTLSGLSRQLSIIRTAGDQCREPVHDSLPVCYN